MHFPADAVMYLLYLKISASSAVWLLLFPVHQELSTVLSPVFSFLSTLYPTYFLLFARKLPIPAFEKYSPSLIFSNHFSLFPVNVPEKYSVHHFFWKGFLSSPVLFFPLLAVDSTLPG